MTMEQLADLFTWRLVNGVQVPDTLVFSTATQARRFMARLRSNLSRLGCS
jgi:hypothetical protein